MSSDGGEGAGSATERRPARPAAISVGGVPARRRTAPADETHAALQKLPGAVFQLLRSATGQWTFPFANREFQRLFMASGQALAADAASIARQVPADDLERLKQQLHQSRESGQVCRARLRLRPPGGDDDAWFELTAAPETAFSGGTLWHGLLMDVSAAHRANGELRGLHRRWTLAAHAAGVGVLEFDLARSRLGLDAIACAHHGIAAEQLWLTLPDWLDRLLPDDRLVAQTALTSAPLEGFSERLVVRLPEPEEGDAADAHARPRAGGVRTLELMFQEVGDEQRLVGTCRDVTQEHGLEALRRDKLAAEKASLAKSEFMSRVSHELRTPLNGITGFVQLMLLDASQPLVATQRRRLDVIAESSTRLMALIDQLLDVASIEEGRMRLAVEAVDIGAAIDQSVASLYPLARERGIAIAIEVMPPAAAVLADRLALGQVLDNLLSNAIKYNRPNGRVRIVFDGLHDGLLRVEDNGVGLSAQQQAQLFEPFNRLGAERSPVRGVGLGLVITRKLVQAMGGDLRVASRPGSGTRVEVRLPAAQAAGPAVSASAALSETVTASASAAGSRGAETAAPPPWPNTAERRVLYIEDDEINTLLMQQIFVTQPGWALSTVISGLAGLEAAQTLRPEVVLLDLHLPDLSGFEVLERLRADPRTRHIPCIAVSADALPAQIEQALAIGFDRYLTKPLDVSRVLAELGRLLATPPPDADGSGVPR